jgi:hypothetical protein
MLRKLAIYCCTAVFVAAALPASAQKAQKGKRMMHHKSEKLACRLGTEDRHARIAVEVVDGAIRNFAYYSKWKPRTCSVYIERGDAYSKWQDAGRLTTVTTEWGSFLIENRSKDVHFIFRNVDRVRYCGMEGSITGSLTVTRGMPQCALQGVMDEETQETTP